MKHPVSGEIKEVSREEFLGLFDHALRTSLLDAAAQPGTAALVCLENLQLDSMSVGDRTALALGPGRTYGLDKIPELRLGDVPSQFQYPTKIWYVTKSDYE